MRCLQGSLGVGELQRWTDHGRAEQNADPAQGRSLPKPTKGLGAEHLKINLHAGVSVPGGLPEARERLLRYCARPPPAVRRPDSVKKNRSTCSDQSDPCAGPAPVAGVTLAEGETAPSDVPSTCEAQRTSSRSEAASTAALPRAEAPPLAPSHDAAEELRFTRLSRLAWATLYQRVFDIDPLACSSCGGRMRFVEVIEDVGRARSEPPPLSRARSPDGD
jgi:hypothetical protein